MRRLTAILNPQADRGRAGRLAETLRDRLAGRVELQLLQTTRRGEAVNLARDAGESGRDGILAIGGDGTVHEVANGLLAISAEMRPPLGVIPAGSGNDFAYAIGMFRDLKRLTALFELGETRPVDAALDQTGSGRERYSINNVGTLLEGQINLASQELEWPRGSGRYLRAVARTLRRRPLLANLRLRCDGREFSRQSAMLSISNGCRSGGRFYLIPDAKIDDGRFDYLIDRSVPMAFGDVDADDASLRNGFHRSILPCVCELATRRGSDDCSDSQRQTAGRRSSYHCGLERPRMGRCADRPPCSAAFACAHSAEHGRL